jgi:hypothetical protein
VTPEGAEKIYISRSKLGKDRGGLLGEWKLESYLAQEGHHIYHPQVEKKQNQLAQYRAARKIIAVDCSPLHLVGYVGDSGQSVGILIRRSLQYGALFERQLRDFRGISVHQIDALVNDWLQGDTRRPNRGSYGEVSLKQMYRKLKAAGLIESESEWEDLTVDERNEDLKRVEKLYGMPFRPLKPDDTYKSTFSVKLQNNSTDAGQATMPPR